jgi:hypothetical protein
MVGNIYKTIYLSIGILGIAFLVAGWSEGKKK